MIDEVKVRVSRYALAYKKKQISVEISSEGKLTLITERGCERFLFRFSEPNMVADIATMMLKAVDLADEFGKERTLEKKQKTDKH